MSEPPGKSTEATNGAPRRQERLQQLKRNRSRRGGSRKQQQDTSNSHNNNDKTSNGSNNEAPPPQKKRRNRKKKSNNNGNSNGGGNNNDKTASTITSATAATPMDIDAEAPTVATAIADPSFMTPHFFKDQPPELLNPLTMRAIIQVMKLERLTEVQYKTLHESRSVENGPVVHNDVLGRARTGTGKTLAFLIVALETILSNPSSKEGIQVLVISPTRELATQIKTQADMVVTFHKKMSVQIVMGGTNIRSDVNRFQQGLPTILVATPGRILDHFSNTQVRGKKFNVNALQVLILDEADQLLEMGFRNDILKIVSYCPPKRQTLLFSATMPKDLRQVMQRAMTANYKTVDCIHDSHQNGGTEMNAHVVQSHIVLPPGMDRLVVSVVECILAAISSENAKIIAFFPTARLVGYFAQLFNDGICKLAGNPFSPVIEIHSRKSQANRNRASDKFRSMESGILFTSDVSARGVDYPNVSHVIQFGLPDSKEQYIHRLGRTGRAGRPGRGWLVLADYERTFLKELGENVPVDAELEQLFSKPPSQQAMDLLNPVLQDVTTGKNQELVKAAQLAYQSWLGFYKDRTKRMVGKMSKAEIVQMANEFAKLTGLSEQPALLKKTVGKMGLKGVPGIKVTNSL